MALPKTLQPALTPDELTFLAEDESIDIVPLFSMTKVRLIGVSESSSTCVDGVGYLWAVPTALGMYCAAVARSVAEEEAEMQDCSSGMAHRR